MVSWFFQLQATGQIPEVVVKGGTFFGGGAVAFSFFLTARADMSSQPPCRPYDPDLHPPCDDLSGVASTFSC